MSMNELATITDNNDAEMRMIEQTGKRLILSSQIADAMCQSSLIPVHLRGKKIDGVWTKFAVEEVKANCILVVNQALRWGVDPFAILPSTFVVGGNLGFDGKLIAAIVNKLGNLAEKLSYEFYGEGDGRTVIVSGRISGEDSPRTVEVSVGQAKTKNEIWEKDPDQKLVYTGATRWTRRHCPQVILGIVSDDEPVYETVEARSVTRAERPGGDSRECFKRYLSRLEHAMAPSAVKDIIDEAMAEPVERINEMDVERLKSVGRVIYSRLAKAATPPPPAAETAASKEPTAPTNYEHLLNQYNEDIEAAATRADVVELLESLNSEESIPIADRRAMCDWANQFAKELPG